MGIRAAVEFRGVSLPEAYLAVTNAGLCHDPAGGDTLHVQVIVWPSETYRDLASTTFTGEIASAWLRLPVPADWSAGPQACAYAALAGLSAEAWQANGLPDFSQGVPA